MSPITVFAGGRGGLIVSETHLQVVSVKVYYRQLQGLSRNCNPIVLGMD